MLKVEELNKRVTINTGNSISDRDKEKLYSNVYEGLPYVATKDVSFDGKINYENGIKIPNKFSSNFKISVSGSTLICAEGGSAGRKIAYSPNDCHYGNKLFSLKPNEEIDSEYLYYYSLSNEFKYQFKKATEGLIDGVSLSKIKKFKITYPTFDIQKNIVKKLKLAFLEINNKIKNLNIKLKESKNLKLSILREKLTNESNKQINYKTKNLKGLAYTAARIGWKGLTAKEYVDSGPLFLSVHSLNFGEYVDMSQAFHITSERYNESPEIMLQSKDILICKDGAGIGKTSIVKKIDYPTTINGSMLLVRALEELESKYLYYYLISPMFQSIIQKKIDGTSTPHLYQRDINFFPISYPSIPHQKKIIDEIDFLFTKINELNDNYKKQLLELDNLKASLLSNFLKSAAYE